MIFNHFHFKVVIRLIIISVSLGLFLYFVFGSGQYLRSIYFLVFACLAVVELFWLIDRTNRDVSNFFEAILQGDFTTTFSVNQKGRSFERLYNALNKITEKYRKIGADKEAQFHFLEMILRQVSVGVISFEPDGKVSMVNDSFKKLTGLAHLTDLKSINKVSPELYLFLKETEPAKSKLKKLQLRGQLLHLSIQASVIRMQSKDVKLVTIQNIQSELEAGEVDAWQKLIRVLAHEILNSVTPITSLTDTMLDILDGEKSSGGKSTDESSNNIYTGLKTIKNRSQALNRFTQAYQSLTRLPKPEFSSISGKEFIGNIETLFSPEMKVKGITWSSSIDPADLQFLGDQELLGQVVINLIKNSLDSLNDNQKGNGVIKLNIERDGENTSITVEDNGLGIPEDQMDKIFMPFYTTRKKGSGIGLALARQIVRMHNGTLIVESNQGEFTRFTVSI